MKEKKSSSAPFLNIGTSSFLVVFLVLCLMTFAILSLTTSRGDYNLARKAADRKGVYYSALNASEEKLAELDELLSSALQQSADYSTYQALLYAELPEYGYVLSTDDDESLIVSFTQEMTDKQALSVSVSLTDPWFENTGYLYRMRSRKITDQTEWEGDETITLIDI